MPRIADEPMTTLSLADTMRIRGISRYHLMKIVERGLVRVQAFEGARPRYSIEDVKAAIRASTSIRTEPSRENVPA